MSSFCTQHVLGCVFCLSSNEVLLLHDSLEKYMALVAGGIRCCV